MKHRNRLLFALTMLLAVLMLVACSGASQPAEEEPSEPADTGGEATEETAEEEPAMAEEPTEEAAVEPMEEMGGGSLTVGLSVEPVSLDPAAGLYLHEHLVLMDIYDTLLSADSDGNLHPGLATDWSASEDGTEFTFTLRDDVTFHDGTPFNAEAVKFAFDRIAQNDFGAASSEAIMTGYTETVVEDEYTARVVFETPKPTFLQDLTHYWMGIPSPTAVEEMGDAFSQNPVGTGPFVFSEWAAQDHITLTRNPDYNWAPEFMGHTGPAYLDEVTFRVLPEAATRLVALQTGEIQVAQDPPGLDVQSLVDSGDYQLETFSSPGMPSHMMINVEKPPTDDIRVRQAMIYSINQEELVQVAFSGLASPAYSVLSPSTWSYDEEAASLYRYDPDMAATLLEDAGWVDEDGDGLRERDGEPLTVVYPAIPAYEEAYMELVTNYLREVGFNVDLLTMDDAGVFEFGNAGNHNFLNMGWVSSDPAVLDVVYDSANIENGSAFTRFVDPELDQALTDAQSELDPDARKALYARAQEIIMENALAMPLYTYDQVYLLSSGVQNWQFNYEGYPLPYDITLAE
jgi:peptide/nickel transport system substrate-binding protein